MQNPRKALRFKLFHQKLKCFASMQFSEHILYFDIRNSMFGSLKPTNLWDLLIHNLHKMRGIISNVQQSILACLKLVWITWMSWRCALIRIRVPAKISERAAWKILVLLNWSLGKLECQQLKCSFAVSMLIAFFQADAIYEF